MKFRFGHALVRRELKYQHILLQALREVVGRIDQRPCPVRDRQIEERALAKRVEERLAIFGLWVEDVEVRLDEIFPWHHCDVGHTKSAQLIEGFVFALGVERLGGIFQAIDIFPIKRADRAESAKAAKHDRAVGAAEQDHRFVPSAIGNPAGHLAMDESEPLRIIDGVFSRAVLLPVL